MISRDIHFGKPTVLCAIDHLDRFLKECKGKEHIVEVITGYGSTGGTHKIKDAALQYLKTKQETGFVKDFICGSELDLFNKKYLNFKYKALLPDEVKRKQNRGAIYIIL